MIFYFFILKTNFKKKKIKNIIFIKMSIVLYMYVIIEIEIK